MIKQCKPCTTVSTILKLMKIHWRNFINDVKSYSKINEIACEISYSPKMSKPLVHGGISQVQKVRDLAKKYNSTQKDESGWVKYNDRDVVEDLVTSFKNDASKVEGQPIN